MSSLLISTASITVVQYAKFSNDKIVKSGLKSWEKVQISRLKPREVPYADNAVKYPPATTGHSCYNI